MGEPLIVCDLRTPSLNCSYPPIPSKTANDLLWEEYDKIMPREEHIESSPPREDQIIERRPDPDNPGEEIIAFISEHPGHEGHIHEHRTTVKIIRMEAPKDD